MRITVHHYHHIEDMPPECSRINHILNIVTRLEKQMSKQDDSITALQTAFDTFKTSVNASLDNIQADETNILNQLNTLDGLTAANQAKVDSIVSDMSTLSAKTQALADSIPDTPVV